MTVAEMVLEFHRVFGHFMQKTPDASGVSRRLQELRRNLLRDEVEEVEDAMFEKDIVGIAQELVYVAYGTALVYGVDLDAVVAEVHRANMSKLQRDGTPLLREDGKVLKSDQFVSAGVLMLDVGTDEINMASGRCSCTGCLSCVCYGCVSLRQCTNRVVIGKTCRKCVR
jgi:predicted HAD superfamily Cof-like phosphohydrolase